jgi:hypothetical protein
MEVTTCRNAPLAGQLCIESMLLNLQEDGAQDPSPLQVLALNRPDP